MTHATHGAGAVTETLSVPIDEVFCPCCEDDLGAAILRLPHVVAAHVDLEHQVARVIELEVRNVGAPSHLLRWERPS